MVAFIGLLTTCFTLCFSAILTVIGAILVVLCCCYCGPVNWSFFL